MADIFRIIWHGLFQAVTKPKQHIHFIGNPRSVYQNQVPWQVSLVTMVIGIIGVCFAHANGIDLLEKVLIAVIAGAGGNLVGLSIAIKETKVHDFYKDNTKKE